jgi:hypothetical protein
MNYTVEIYKSDARTKSGNRLSKKFEVDLRSPKDAVLLHYRTYYPVSQGYRVEVYETFVTRKNALTGAEFQERYDTPYFCSPSSESYWSA